MERIDLYQLHTVDPEVPFEESVGALAELRSEGKVRHVGLSNVSAEEIERAREIVPVVSIQNRFSVAERESDPLVDLCEREGVAFIPWFPLVAGWLVQNRGPWERIAAVHDATVPQIALAWLLHRSPSLLPIPGTSSLEHLDENVAAAGLRLSDRELEGLSAP